MINWMRYKLLYFLLSALVLVPGFYSLVRFGLKPSIDFTGGTLLEIKLSQPADLTLLQETARKLQLPLSSIQPSGENQFLLRFQPITKEQNEEFKNQLKEKIGGSVDELRFEIVGPILGRELIKKTVVAIVLAAGFILLYIAYRFQDKKYGICAILAMFHDTFILLGTFSLLGHFYGVEVDTLFVTAVLTILSFSVHDTVVVYDRIRESLRKHPRADFTYLVNKAITETLTRSLNNSLTIIFMLLALYLLGGQTIRWFVFALLIGTIAGTYSSTFTAAPLLVVWEQLRARKQKRP